LTCANFSRFNFSSASFKRIKYFYKMVSFQHKIFCFNICT